MTQNIYGSEIGSELTEKLENHEQSRSRIAQLKQNIERKKEEVLKSEEDSKVHELLLDYNRLVEELEEKNGIDNLTGLYNRNRFDEHLENSIMGSLKGRRKEDLNVDDFYLILVDIDDFKLFNDRYGHVVGDQALEEVGSIIDNNKGSGNNEAYRYGGEEFAILSYQGCETTNSIAENIRESISRRNMRLKDEDNNTINENVTVSVGVSPSFTDFFTNVNVDHSQDIEDIINGYKTGFINIADDRLYDAKSNGKNRLCNGKTYDTTEDKTETLLAPTTS